MGLVTPSWTCARTAAMPPRSGGVFNGLPTAPSTNSNQGKVKLGQLRTGLELIICLSCNQAVIAAVGSGPDRRVDIQWLFWLVSAVKGPDIQAYLSTRWAKY